MRHWIFQANPDRFLLDDYLKSAPVMSRWLVVQFEKEIAPGDNAFIWRARGKRKLSSGIVAQAEVISRPMMMPDYPDAVNFWTGGSDRSGLRCRVDIRFIRASGYISSTEIAGDPVLSSLSILKFANATNFRVTDEQALRLNELW
jgi:hypothetical protein